MPGIIQTLDLLRSRVNSTKSSQRDPRQRQHGQEDCVSRLTIQHHWYVLSGGQHATVAVGCRFQLRCLMETPLHVQQGQVITGELRLAAHNRQSYDVFVDLTAPALHPGQLPQKVLHLHSLCTPSPLVHSCTHPLPCWLTHSLACLLTGLLTHWLARLLTH